MSGFSGTDTITIPIPERRERQFGAKSSVHNEAGMIFVRTSPAEQRLIEKACTILGLKKASLTRDVLVNACEQIVEKYNAHQRRDRS